MHPAPRDLFFRRDDMDSGRWIEPWRSFDHRRRMILSRLVCIMAHFFFTSGGLKLWQMREAEAMVRLTFFPFYSWSFCQKVPGLCWDVWRGATRCTFESNVLIMQPVFVVRTWHNEKATNMGEKKMWQEWCVVASHFWDVCLRLTPDQLLRLVPLSKLLDATFLWCWTELLETLQPCSHFEILTLFLI